MKTKEKNEARHIRVKEQLTLQDIAKRLGVAKSTVSLWVRDLPLHPLTIKRFGMQGCIKSGEIRAKKAKEMRIQHQLNGRRMAQIHEHNPLFVGGCMMHWSEGAKERNRADICNTDPYFLRLWMNFITQFFEVEQIDFRIHIKCYLNNGKTQQQIEEYWIQQLSVPKACFTKTTIIKKHPMSSGVKKNRHPYGVIRININSTEIVQKIWGAIKFLADIDDSEKWIY